MGVLRGDSISYVCFETTHIPGALICALTKFMSPFMYVMLGRILAPAHEQAAAMGFGTQKFLRSGFLDACSIGCRDTHGHLQMHFAYKAPAVSRVTGRVTSQ